MANEVEASTSAEISKVMRAAAQVGLLLAERRRQQLWRAEQDSRAQARQLQSVVEEQRRLAAPVWSKATDPRFWQAATPQEAAFVHGMAKRFEDVDLTARHAARHCEEQAVRKWGLTRASLQPGSGPVDLPPRTQALISPTLPGDQAVDWAILEAKATEVTGPPRADTSKQASQGQAAHAGPVRAEPTSRAYRIANARKSARQRLEGVHPGVEATAGTRPQKNREKTARDVDLEEGIITAAAGTAVAEEAAEVVWDSQKARAAWAQDLLEQGFEPDAVRAAFTADQVLTEPVGSITPATGGIAEQNHPAAHFAEVAMRAELGMP